MKDNIEHFIIEAAFALASIAVKIVDLWDDIKEWFPPCAVDKCTAKEKWHI